MKLKHFFKLGFIALLAVNNIACKHEIESDGIEGEPIKEQLTSEETTQYLQKAAQEIISTFNANDQKEVIALGEFFLYEFTTFAYDWGAFEDKYTSDSYKAIWSMPRYALDVASGRRLASQVSDYTFDFRNESVTFEADDITRTWVCKGPNSDNSITFIYNHTASGKKYVAKVRGEGKTKTYSTDVQWRDWTWIDGYYDANGNWVEGHSTSETVNKTYTVVMPEKIVFNFSENTTEHVRVEVALEMKENRHISCAINGRVANLVWKTEANVASKHAEFAVSYNYDGRNLFAVEGTIPDYVTIDKEDNQTWEDWLKLYGEQYEALIDKAGGASVKVYLLDKAQIITEAESAAKFYKAYKAWDQKYPFNMDLNWYEQPYRQRDAQIELANIHNDNVYVGLYYNSKTEQAQVKMDVRQEEAQIYGRYDEFGNWIEEYETVSYYETIPVLYFPADGTSYEFEQYYEKNEAVFMSLWEPLKDMINQYIALLQYFDVEPIQ